MLNSSGSYCSGSTDPTAVGDWKAATPKGVDHDEQLCVQSTMIASLTYGVADTRHYFKASET